MPLRGHLRCVVVMLRKVNPSVAAWHFIFGVQVLKVPVAELISTDERASLGITDVLHLMPPLLYARSADISDIPNKRHHVVAEVKWRGMLSKEGRTIGVFGL